jgi:hypothetical protein
MEKAKPYAISTGVDKLWKAKNCKTSRFVVLARAGTKSFVPLWFRAVRYDL